jgi:AcrR family transcriptional regulator
MPVEIAQDGGRRDAIIEAARATFIHYGFRRTSLDEIARQADISRTGLYHHFRNKEEIFRAVTEDLHERALGAAERAAAAQGAAGGRLLGVLDAKLGWFLDILSASRHGDELIDQTNRLCGELVVSETRRYLRVLARVFREADEAGEISLGAAELTADGAASHLHLCAQGLAGPRGASPSPAQYRRRLERLVRITVAALRARTPVP